jgi:hypothetical protein
LFAECIITIIITGSQHANITISVTVLVIAWANAGWDPPAGGEVAIIRERAHIIQGAGFGIIAWRAAFWRFSARNSDEISIIGAITIDKGADSEHKEW